VHIEKVIPPAPKRTSRRLDRQHVEFLMHSFNKSGIQLTILVGMVPKRCDPSMFKTKGVYKSASRYWFDE